MSEQPKDGGPAFPWGEHGERLGGLTVRDYFAAHALAMMVGPPDYSRGTYNEAAAARAYSIADSMLAEREKEREPNE